MDAMDATLYIHLSVSQLTEGSLHLPMLFSAFLFVSFQRSVHALCPILHLSLPHISLWIEEGLCPLASGCTSAVPRT